MSGVWKLWLAASGSMAVVTLGAMPVFCRDWFWGEMALGWALSLLNGALGTWLHRRALGSDAARFMAWGVLGSILRLLVTVAMVLLFSRWLRGARLAALAVTVVVGFLCFTAAEVVWLYRHAAADSVRHE